MHRIQWAAAIQMAFILLPLALVTKVLVDWFLTLDRSPVSPETAMTAHGFLYLVVGAAMFVLSFHVLALVNGRDRRVLVLRRFHHEDSVFDSLFGASTGLRAMAMFDALGALGFDVVTLRDSKARGDPTMLLALIPIYVILFMLCVFMPVGMLLCLGVLTALVAPFFIFAAPDSMVRGIAVAAFCAGVFTATVAWRDLIGFAAQAYGRYFGALPALAERLFLRGRRLRDPARARRWLKRPFQAGVTVVSSSDENWRELVLTLIASVDAICFDLRWPSENCDDELRFIKQEDAQDRVVWFAPKGEAARFVVQTGADYTIRNVSFEGRANVLELPYSEAKPIANLSQSFAATLEAFGSYAGRPFDARVGALLKQFDQIRRRTAPSAKRARGAALSQEP